MAFFDKVDNSMIVGTSKQFLKRIDREIVFTDIPQIGRSCIVSDAKIPILLATDLLPTTTNRPVKN